MNEEARIKELVDKEITHARELIEREPTCDNLADAASVLTRAANRLAPTGHSFRFVHDEWSPSIAEIERERLRYVAEVR